MIKKGVAILFLFGMLSPSFAQSVHIQQDEEITIDDLKPKINYADSDHFYQPLREKSGLALLSSAIIPGTGQAANSKWVRAGAYFLAEAVFLGIHFTSYNNAKAEQRQYEQFADGNWSVVNYAQWLVDYHEENNLTNPHLDNLRAEVEGKSPSYDPNQDWQKVDLELLRMVERETPFVYSDNENGNNFSHELPDYGSQQYYELISKYYQYGPGWNDFGEDRDGNRLDSLYQLNWDGTDMPFNFLRGGSLAEDFNDSYRLAGNMVSLVILNHIISAFDAFLTVKVKNNRLETKSSFLNPTKAFTLKYHF